MTRKPRIGEVIDMASRKQTDEPAWVARLARTKDGESLPTVANAIIILANDPELAGMSSYNEFAWQAMLMRAPPTAEGGTTKGPFPRPWERADVALILAYFQRIHSPKFKTEAITDALYASAATHSFHPVRDWVNGLEWDGEPRLNFWLPFAVGADNDAYHWSVGSKFLIAAVRRVRHPGCKFDDMLLLEGPQGIGKSRACRLLFGDAWFTDTLPSDLTSRDISQALGGVWAVEFAEIEHLIRSDPEAIKSFLSRQTERLFERYGRTIVERPRQCVFLGTTNKDDYGRDSTGDRRYWPVHCRSVDIDWLTENRNQIWAEAAARELDGEPLWLEDESTRAVAKAHQSARYDEDPWEDKVLSWAAGMDEVRVPEIMTECLYLSAREMNKAAQMRIANILRANDWARQLKRNGDDGKPGRRWLRLKVV